MESLGRALMGLGLLLLVVGAWLAFGPSLPGVGWLGKLPGDIYVDRPGFKLYLPITTCIVISVVLSLVVALVQKLR